MNNKLTLNEKLFLIRILLYTILAATLSSQYTVPIFKFIIYIYTEVLVYIYYPDTTTILYD